MNVRAKSFFILAAALLIGGIVGSLATSAVHNKRWEDIRNLTSPKGFMEVMEEVIGPTDEAQRAQIQAVLIEHGDRIGTVRRSYYATLRAMSDTMRVQLAPILDEAQQGRLDDWFSRDARTWRRNDSRGRSPEDRRRPDDTRSGHRPSDDRSSGAQ
jgi:hypothetical protein